MVKQKRKPVFSASVPDMTTVPAAGADANKREAQNTGSDSPFVFVYQSVTVDDVSNVYEEAKRVVEKSLVLSFGSKYLIS